MNLLLLTHRWGGFCTWWDEGESQIIVSFLFHMATPRVLACVCRTITHHHIPQHQDWPQRPGSKRYQGLWATNEAGGWIGKENLHKTTFFKGMCQNALFCSVQNVTFLFYVLNDVSKFYFITKTSRNSWSCYFSSLSRHFSVFLFNFTWFFLQTLGASNELAHQICTWSCSLPGLWAFVTADLNMRSRDIKLRTFRCQQQPSSTAGMSITIRNYLK